MRRDTEEEQGVVAETLAEVAVAVVAASAVAVATMAWEMTTFAVAPWVVALPGVSVRLGRWLTWAVAPVMRRQETMAASWATWTPSSPYRSPRRVPLVAHQMDGLVGVAGWAAATTGVTSRLTLLTTGAQGVARTTGWGGRCRPGLQMEALNFYHRVPHGRGPAGGRVAHREEWS